MSDEPTVDQTTHDHTDGGEVAEGSSVLTAPEQTGAPAEPEAPAEQSTEPDVTEPASFAIPDQFKDDPRFEGVDSLEALVEKLSEPQGATTVDDYAAAMEGLNDEQMTAFKSAMLERGLTAEQYEGIAEFYNGNMKKNQELRNKMVDEYTTKVRENWGDEFDNNLKGAKQALNVAAQEIPGLKDMMADPVLGSHPVTLELFRWISSKISEDTLLTGDVPGGSVPRSLPKDGGVEYFTTYDKSMK